MAEEQYKHVNWEAEKNELQAEVSRLRHALNDLQSATGELDVRSILRRYQTQEVQDAKQMQKLQEQLKEARQELETTKAVTCSVKAKNAVRLSR